MNNGDNRRGPRNPVEAALAAAKAAPAPAMQQQINPVDVFSRFFGLNGPTLQAMQVNVVPCMCGRCQGVGVQMEVRMHFPIIGPPELITRGDSVKAPAQGLPAQSEPAPPAPQEPTA